MTWDASGLERVPFNGSPGLPLRSKRLRPAPPELNADERQAERRERADLAAGIMPSCPKCGHEPIHFSLPCPSCGVDWSGMIA